MQLFLENRSRKAFTVILKTLETKVEKMQLMKFQLSSNVCLTALLGAK